MLTGDSVRQNTWFITKLSAWQIQRTKHWKKWYSSYTSLRFMGNQVVFDVCVS